MYEQDAQQPLSTSAMAITGFVIGLVALLTSFMPIINNFSFILGLLALIFSIVGLVGCARGKKKGKGLAIAALLISIISCVIVIWSQSVYSAAIDDAFSTTKAATSTTKAATTTTTTSSAKTMSDSKADSADSGSDASASKANSEQAATDASSAQASTDESGLSTAADSTSSAASTPIEAADTAEQYAYQITVDGCDLDESYDGKLCAVITYTFTNNSDEATSFSGSIRDKAYQNGVELSNAIVSGWDTIDNAIKDVKPGATITVSGAFILDDESDITVECTEWGAYDDVILAEATFPVV